MILFDEIDINGNIIKFYDGIDYEFVINYDKKELIVIFIEDWTKEQISFIREAKINSLFGGQEYKKLEDINNNYIAIYQTSGYLEIVAESIKKKLLINKNINHNEPWFVNTSKEKINI
jgi:hypothetical protein